MSSAPAALSGSWCHVLPHQRSQRESWRPLSAPNHSGVSYKMQILASPPSPPPQDWRVADFPGATFLCSNSCWAEQWPLPLRRGRVGMWVSRLPATDPEMFLPSEATTQPLFLPRCSSSVQLRILSPCHGVMCSPDWRCPAHARGCGCLANPTALGHVGPLISPKDSIAFRSERW